MSAKPKLLGRCIGQPGLPCGRPVYDDEIGAVALEKDFDPRFKNPVLGSCCYEKLFPVIAIKPQTASQMIQKKKKAGKMSAAIGKNRLHVTPD